ncbi:MAG: DUF1080 domain-containing protein [Verrucomicrobia bacterium]|nr:DUF1080 domain-containing protein [Verrucomicrobiota bacterium]
MTIPTTEHKTTRRVAAWLRLNVAVAWIGCAALSCAAEKATGGKSPAKPAPSVTASTNAAVKSLFDGKTLTGWKVTDFAGHGEVLVKDGTIVLETGQMTGITLTNANDLPRMNYELTLDAMRVEGSDFFCGLTFPVGNDPCSLIVGGWGGGVIGLSSIDSQDAASNETTKYMSFKSGRWYAIRLRVTPGKIEAWIDEDKVIDVSTEGHTLSIRLEVEESKPLGIASWSTTAALRNIKVRKL